MFGETIVRPEAERLVKLTAGQFVGEFVKEVLGTIAFDRKSKMMTWRHGAGRWDAHLLLEPKTSRRRRRRLRGQAKEAKRLAA